MQEPFAIPQVPDEMQKAFEAVKQIMQVRKRGAVPMAMVHTYGCQQNAADGERMKGMLSQMGFSFTDSPDEADLVLFNTCAVREHAEDRVFGNVGALKNQKRRHPGMIIALCGCMMEQEHVAERIKKSFPYVNLVFGTHVIHRLPFLLLQTLTDSKRVFERGDETPDKQIPEGLPVAARQRQPRVCDGDVRVQQLLFLLHRAVCARAGTQPRTRRRGGRVPRPD